MRRCGAAVLPAGPPHLRSQHGVLVADCLQQLAQVSDAIVQRARLVVAAVTACASDALLNVLCVRVRVGSRARQPRRCLPSPRH
jgi:hypothetical protein